MGTWVASTLWLLQIILLWTWVYKYLFDYLISTLWDRSPDLKWLSHLVILCLIFFFKELTHCFLPQLGHLTFPPAIYGGNF